MPMNKAVVTLPKGDNICTLQLTRLIAETLVPSLENIEGLDCIRGMRKPVPGGTFPFELTDADRKILKPLLSKLPVLRANMSEQEKDNFLNAYRKLTNKPDGEPYFRNEDEVQQQRYVAQELDYSHQEALRKKIKAGEIKVFDEGHRPTDTLGYNTFLSRSDAIAYLTAINLVKRPTLTREALAHVDDTDAVPTQTPHGHSLDGDIPHLYKRVVGIGRVAIRAAWHIQLEKKSLATANETYVKLIQWYKEQSPHAEGLIVGYDEKKRQLKWYANGRKLEGTLYTLEGCKRHIEEWQADFKKYDKK